jgi:hypothetical protein
MKNATQQLNAKRDTGTVRTTIQETTEYVQHIASIEKVEGFN